MKKIRIGGQAIIEGVLMRVNDIISMAVRKPNKEIILKKEKLNSVMDRYKILRIPFIRGIITFFQIIFIGSKALTWSANQQQESKEEELGTIALVITIIFSFIIGIGIFTLLPYSLTNVFGLREQQTPLIFNLVDGILKLVILVAYLMIISRMKDIKRMFQYHGAEHKTIKCYEAKKELTLENIKKYSTIHPRCGTSFLLLVILTGVLILSFIPIIVAWIYPPIREMSLVFAFPILFLSRVMMMPVVAGVSYEILKFGDKYYKNPFVKILILPGLLLQKITTQPPEEDMIEVSIASLKHALEEE